MLAQKDLGAGGSASLAMGKGSSPSAPPSRCSLEAGFYHTDAHGIWGGVEEAHTSI